MASWIPFETEIEEGAEATEDMKQENPQSYLFNFVKERKEAVHHTNGEISKIVGNVKWTKEQAKQEMFERRNDANFRWQQLDNNGVEDRAVNDFLTQEVVKSIDEETSEYIQKQKAELERYKSIQEETLKLLAEESKQNIGLLQQKQEQDISKMKERTELVADEINNQMLHAKFHNEEVIGEFMDSEKDARNKIKLKNESEMDELNNEFEKRMREEKAKQDRIREKAKFSFSKYKPNFPSMPTCISSKFTSSQETDKDSMDLSNYYDQPTDGQKTSTFKYHRDDEEVD